MAEDSNFERFCTVTVVHNKWAETTTLGGFGRSNSIYAGGDNALS